jgi:hypothetical protein
MSTSSTSKHRLPEQVALLNECDASRVRSCLEESGAVVVRAGAGLEDFVALSDKLMHPAVHHSTSTAVERDPVNADATTATVNKGMDSIPLHREGSYAPGCPDVLMLYCVRPADAGGETILCDGVNLVESLPARTRDFVENAVLKWGWKITPERWMAALGVASKTEAEARLKQISARLADWEKLDAAFDGDTLDGVYQTLCVIPTKWGGRRSFCNSLLIYHYRSTSEYYPKHIYTPTLGDGSPFPADVLAEAAECARSQTYDMLLEEKDILLVDNSRYMHGRRGFADAGRRILFRMGHVKGGQ